MDIELHELDLRYAALRRRDARRERGLVASLAESGQQVPVVVVRGATGPFVLVDGYKRVRALERLHRDTVAAVVWELSELEALLLVRVLRNGAGDTALEQGWLLWELCERFRLTLGELARRFDKSESWVSRRLALVRELPEAVQELVRSGALVAHAAMKHLVPLARANLAHCLALAPALAAHGLTSRQVGTLCAAFVAGTEESRTLILTAPHVVLRAEAESKRPKEKSDAERLLSDVAAVAAIARRARRLVSAEPGRVATWWPRGELGRAMAAAESDTAAFFTLVRKEMSDVGREQTNSDLGAS
ncbi:MAG: ParB N-terminal domain-containing protein [Deltaproteobacteria bacterium]|nr:ParB N-terminal domain-containing protein [Deltaproteobacteria bacterium]